MEICILRRRVAELKAAAQHALLVMTDAAHPDFLRHLAPAMRRLAHVLRPQADDPMGVSPVHFRSTEDASGDLQAENRRLRELARHLLGPVDEETATEVCDHYGLSWPDLAMTERDGHR